MALAMFIPNITFFTLVQLIVVAVARIEFSASHDATNYTSSWKSGRSKRSLHDELPSTLVIGIQYGTEEVIKLHWNMAHQYLANEHLPVITSRADINPNIMENVGEFVVYYDLTKSSAVVYFAKSNRLYGVIGMDYYIRGLPFNFDAQGKYTLGTVGQPYVNKRARPTVHMHPVTVPLQTTNKRPTDGDPGPSTKHQRTKRNFVERVNSNETIIDYGEVNLIRNRRGNTRVKQYYLETLVFVTKDIAALFKSHYGEGSYIEWIVRNHIIYFSSVDMIFQKMRNCKNQFYINIAKIVIEDESMPFPFMLSNGELQFSDVTEKLSQFLRLHRFEPDSFDYVFVHTSPTITKDLSITTELTRYGADLYGARKNNQFYEAVPISLVGFEYVYADYMVAVHGISRILNMKIESQADRSGFQRQYHGTMKNAHDTLEWSDENRHLYIDFFRENRNRCFFWNTPRSLRSHGVFKDLSPYQQCQCFGYQSYITYENGSPLERIGVDQCNEDLQCESADEIGRYHELTVRPFDGTPCSYNRVCWNARCVNMFAN